LPEEVASEEPELLQLTALVVGARGVRRGDWFPGASGSGCFCVVKWIRGREQVVAKTREDRQVEPFWNEEADVPQWEPGDDLEFSVWDSFSPGAKMPEGSTQFLVGRVRLHSKMFQKSGFNGELPLTNLGRHISSAFLTIKVKLPGQDYPDGLAPEFRLTILKDPQQDAGVELDTQDTMNAYIVGLKAGPFQEHNLRAPKSDHVKAGQFIVQANDDRSTAASMADIVRNGSRVDMIIRRPLEMTVAVDKKDKKAPLGIDFPAKITGNNLLIVGLKDGPVNDWNLANPDLEVKLGDRITAVNGQSGKATELCKKMKALDRFLMTIVRPA